MACFVRFVPLALRSIQPPFDFIESGIHVLSYRGVTLTTNKSPLDVCVFVLLLRRHVITIIRPCGRLYLVHLRWLLLYGCRRGCLLWGDGGDYCGCVGSTAKHRWCTPEARVYCNSTWWTSGCLTGSSFILVSAWLGRVGMWGVWQL